MSVWQTSDGGYIVVGSQGGNLFVLKTDENGEKQWVQIYPRPNGNTITGESIKQTPDGGYIWAGYKSGKTCLLKADSKGDEQWNKTYDGFQASSVQQTWDDGYVFTDDRSGLVIRTDSAGNVLWQKTVTGLGLLEGDSVLHVGNGSFVVAGVTKTDKSAKEQLYVAEFDKDFTPVPNAQVASENTPNQWEASQSYTVSVTFLNNGTKPWTFQDKTMFSPVGGLSGDAALFGVTENQTIPIGTVIRPGQGMKFDYVMTAPAMNGTYYPEVRMVWGDHQYFGEPVNKAVKVVNGTPDTR